MTEATKLDQELLTQIEQWLEGDPDEQTREALIGLRARAQADDAKALEELRSAFSGPLAFGTAGLRGPLGPGPNRMNRVVVQRAAAGFAAWLQQQGHDGGKVIIGYDARHHSDLFARDTAEIMAGAGFEALLTDQPTPTPVVAFGIKHFGCVAGVVVTASHNPATDNGYKVYLGDGSQIVPPTDAQIAECIAGVATRPLAEIERSEEYTTLGDELPAAYVARAKKLAGKVAPAAKELNWVYTAMHGVGGEIVHRVIEACGFAEPRVVQQQQQPDPDFPTVEFPNPEEPGAIDLALELAQESGADFVVANDPDADRCAVAVPVDGKWRMLRGDELGVLLGDDAIRRGAKGVYANSIVSSTLLGTMAKSHGLRFENTLTGFKWIGRVPELGYGYEEAIGYCTDPEAVPDKDGITTLVRVVVLAASLRSEGKTLIDRLDEIVRTYGHHATDAISRRVADLSLISDAMKRIRENPPQQLLGEPITVEDLAVGGVHGLPATDAVEFTGDKLHVVVRPSGTEPKLKCYIEYRLPPEDSQDVPAARGRAAQAIARLRAELTAALGI